MRTPEKVAIVVALIGLAGTIGAAIIGSGHNPFSASPTSQGVELPPTQPTATTNKSAPTNASFAPHAPPIQLSPSSEMWGEQTKLLSLEPGQKIELDGRNLYSEATTYPQSSCSGPGYIVYTWQVRQPYPEGGDLEIRSIIPQGGGNTEQLAMGAMGKATMGPCGIHVFINRGLQPMKLELRYATAVDPTP